MCMRRDLSKQKAWIKGHTGKVTVWKVYEVDGNDVFSVCQDQQKLNRRTPGCIQSNRYLYSNSLHSETYHNARVAYGIHVFLTREDARRYRGLYSSRTRPYLKTFKCSVDTEDVVAIGKDQCGIRSAVFDRIFISDGDFAKAKKGGFR